MAVILNLAILDSAILVFPLKVTHTFQYWFPLFTQKNFTHSFWLNLMMAAILKSAMLDLDTAILDSDTLLSSLRFTQKQSQSTLTLTHSNSIWLTGWWQPYLNSAILDSAILHKTLSRSNTIIIKVIHSDSTWWWQLSWILPSCIQPFAQKKLHSCILTQIDDGSHLEFCHVGFKHLVIFSQIHSKTVCLYSDFDSN